MDAAIAKPLGYDPAKLGDGPKVRQSGARGNTRLDLPAEAYLSQISTIKFPQRQSFNSNSRARKIYVNINQFAIKQLQVNKHIYQYYVSVKFLGEKEPKKIETLIKKAWEQDSFKKALEVGGARWLHDGKNLAWTTVKLDAKTVTVDLDAGKINNKGGNKIEVKLRVTTKINLSMIMSYVEGKTDMDESVLEALNFLDHLIRQYPSEKSLAIKRQFYDKETLDAKPLAPHVYAAKGTYASVRLNQTSAGGTGIGLGINVDVVNTAFWADRCSIIDLTRKYCQWRWNYPSMPDPHELIQFFRPDKNGNPSETMQELRRISKIRVTCEAQRKLGLNGEHMMNGFAHNKALGAEGLTAKTYRFEYNGVMIRYIDFCKVKYGVHLIYPDWPLIQTQRPGVLIAPELCMVAPLQRFPFKLDKEMTSKMIRITTSKPEERRRTIEKGCNALNWGSDPYFKHFGIQVSQDFIKTQAVLLPAPKVEYGGKPVSPPPKARWDLRGLRFKAVNTHPIARWGFLFDQGAQAGIVEKFADDFRRCYETHGGRFVSKKPQIRQLERDAAASIDKFNRLLCDNHPGERADIIFVVLSHSESGKYEAVKKAADCRVGIVTQCLLLKNVKKSDPQYHSNVAMKVNAKLGGITSTVDGINSTPLAPALFMGVDVSHAPASISAPSMAAMTLSVERFCSKYAAAVETNGFRKEILTPENTRGLLNRLIPAVALDPKKVKTIFYMRDGVSECQFQQVLDEEVAVVKTWFKEKLGTSPKFTVIVATKNHHIRFFPSTLTAVDHNKNPLPGIVVERDITHPRQHDFYLCSHSAIQGTARPVHYNVIMDESNCSPTQLHSWIYEACFQYMRSSCAVSLHPAIYYAHLAANRARAHEHSNVVRTGETGMQFEQQVQGAGGQGQDTTNVKLMPLGGPVKNPRFTQNMWYI